MVVPFETVFHEAYTLTLRRIGNDDPRLAQRNSFVTNRFKLGAVIMPVHV